MAGTKKKKKSVGMVGVLIVPTGISDIGVRRTHCDLGGNMTLGTQREMEERTAGSKKTLCTNNSRWLCRILDILLCVRLLRPEAYLYKNGSQARTIYPDCLQ